MKTDNPEGAERLPSVLYIQKEGRYVKSMPNKNKLEDLKVKKVDFVPAGCNQGANLLIFKGREAADEKNAPGAEDGGKSDNPVKKMFAVIGKALGFKDDQIDTAFDEVIKGGEAETFADKLAERQTRKIRDEIWDVCFALENSLCSIIADDDVSWPDKAAMMQDSVTQFMAAVGAYIPKWTTGVATQLVIKSEMTPERLALAKAARERLDAVIQKAEPETNPTGDGGNGISKTKGEQEDMKIDKSKLTPEEQAQYDAIVKKAGIEAEPGADGNPAPVNPDEPVNKGADGKAPAPGAANEGEEDIYKGLHPAVKEELQRLRKSADAVEDRELTEIAKKYEIIGKKPEELVPVLKSLKTAGGDAYDQMITVLDASKEAFEKSGIFTELGKSGGDGSAAGPWTQIEKHADEIQKSAPNLTRAQAIDKACEQHADLVAQYENDR